MFLEVRKGKKVLEHINNTAREAGIEVYAVGGFVRDLYLGKEGTDIDFLVVGDAIQFTHQFKKKCGAGKVVTYPRFGTAGVHYKNFKLEFVTARAEHYDPNSRKPQVRQADLESDLSRRDFTINTLAMDLSPEHFGKVIDVYNGIQDIKIRIIRTPLDPVLTFSDDPLRILRAIRFAAVLDFHIEEKTYQAIVETRQRLTIVSQERITEEFRKMMLANRPSTGLRLLKDTGVLSVIFPELEQLFGVEQRKDFHHKDVFDHTLQVVDKISKKTDKFELRMAALLHDIAKPQTKRFDEEKGWTFHGHEELGARMSERIGRRMRLPLATIKYLKKLIRLHLRPMQLVDESVTDSAIRRLIVETGDEMEDLLVLCRADITSKNPGKVKRFQQNFDLVEQRMKEVEEKDKLRTFKVAINGNDIMEILNIPPGPTVGMIKKAVTDAVLDGKIPNEHDACVDYMMRVKDDFLENH